jgi:hypothetical protein
VTPRDEADIGARARADRNRRWTGPGRRAQPARIGIVAIVLLLILCFFVARTCQQSQIRVTQEQAIATAKDRVRFEPEDTQIRLLRQGLDREPFWVVSLSIPSGDNTFSALAVVRIDANTGEVVQVDQGVADRKRNGGQGDGGDGP